MRSAFTEFHSEEAYASGNKKRPRGPRSSAVQDLTCTLKVLSPPPLLDLKTRAIQHYFEHHVRTSRETPDLLRSITDDLEPIWTSDSAERPIVDLAISSVALAVFSRGQLQPRAARSEASLIYGQLLQRAQSEIITLDSRSIDLCLLMVFFMGRYEDTVHTFNPSNYQTPFQDTIRAWSHHDGCLAILKTWKERLSHRRQATKIIKHSRRVAIKSALLRTKPLPEWMHDGAVFGEDGLELEFDTIVVQIANLRHRLSTLLGEIGQQPDWTMIRLKAAELNVEAQRAEKALHEWSTHFPSSWSGRQHNLPTPCIWPSKFFYGSYVYSYSHVAYAAVWARYYSTVMLVCSARLRVLKLINPTPDHDLDKQRSECLFTIKDMTDFLISTIPFCLERFRVSDASNLSTQRDLITLNSDEDAKPYLARLVVWPLSVGSSLEEVNTEQRMWFKSQLSRIGESLGTGVLACASQDRWMNL